MDRRLGGGGGNTPCHTREKGKLSGPKGKRENSLPRFGLEFHLATRPRARTNETKRFPGRSHPPTSDPCIHVKFPMMWSTRSLWRLIMKTMYSCQEIRFITCSRRWSRTYALRCESKCIRSKSQSYECDFHIHMVSTYVFLFKCMRSDEYPNACI